MARPLDPCLRHDRHAQSADPQRAAKRTQLGRLQRPVAQCLRYPNPDHETLQEILNTYGVRRDVFVTTMAQAEGIDGRPLPELVNEYWPLDEISRNYETFIDHFSDLPELIKKSPAALSPEVAFIIR